MIDPTIQIIDFAKYGALGSTVIAVVTYIYRSYLERQKYRLISERQQFLRERHLPIIVAPHHGSAAKTDFPPELVRSLEDQIFNRLATAPGLSRDAVKAELDQQLSEVQKRIEKIENRFPEESQIEKIASINDALLSERIDQLSKQLQNLEKRILSKWDVAIIVSTVIGGIAAVVGTTYSILHFFHTP